MRRLCAALICCISMAACAPEPPNGGVDAGTTTGEQHLDNLNTWSCHNIRDYGAIPNDANPDHAAIQAALDAGDACIPEGTYLIGAPIIATATHSGRRIIGSGNVVLRRSTTSHFVQIGSQGANGSAPDGFTVEGITFDFNSGPPGETGIVYRGPGMPKNVRIRNNKFIDATPVTSGVDQWAIVPQCECTGTPENLWIENNYVNGDMQLLAAGTRIRNVWVTGNHVVNSRTVAISLSGLLPPQFENIHIERNTLEGGYGGVFLGPDGTTSGIGGFLKNIVVSDNVIRNLAGGTIGVQLRSTSTNTGIVITGNRIADATGANDDFGVRLERFSGDTSTTFDNVVVADNAFEGLRSGIELWYTRRGVVSGNELDTADRALGLYYTSSLTITGNNVRTLGAGFVVQGTTRTLVITGNTLLDFGSAANLFDAGFQLGGGGLATDRIEVLATGNRVGNTSAGGVADFAIVQATGPVYDTHFFDNDFRFNRDAVQTGAGTTVPKSYARNLGPYLAPSTASLTFNLTSAASQDVNVSFYGAVPGDVVTIGIPAAAMAVGPVTYTAWVSAPNVVTVRGLRVGTVSAAVTATFDIRVERVSN
jgi:hypothetical protein